MKEQILFSIVGLATAILGYIIGKAKNTINKKIGEETNTKILDVTRQVVIDVEKEFGGGKGAEKLENAIAKIIDKYTFLDEDTAKFIINAVVKEFNDGVFGN